MLMVNDNVQVKLKNAEIIGTIAEVNDNVIYVNDSKNNRYRFLLGYNEINKLEQEEVLYLQFINEFKQRYSEQLEDDYYNIYGAVGEEDCVSVGVENYTYRVNINFYRNGIIELNALNKQKEKFDEDEMYKGTKIVEVKKVSTIFNKIERSYGF
jgi:hypothetical protein